MLLQKIFGAGNSDVVAIPKSLMEELGLSRGEKVVIDKTSDGSALLIRSAKSKVSKAKLNKEFKTWLKNVLKEDEEILDELSLR